VFVAGWCLIAAAPAHAGEWTLGFFVGTCTTRSNTLTLDRPVDVTHVSVRPVEYDAHSFESPPYYGYRVGRALSPHFGIEAEFMHAKAFARTADRIRATGRVKAAAIDSTVPLSSVMERFAMSHGLNFVVANVVYRQGIGHSANPRAFMLARAGAGITVPHVESTIAAESREQYEAGGLGVQASLGAELRVRGHLHSFAELKVTTTAESAWRPGRSAVASRRFTQSPACPGTSSVGF
jgi:hypothetical protein